MAKSNEDALIEEILGDAEKKARRSTRRAEREAKQVVEKAQKQADDIVAAATEAARDKAERERATVMATIDIDRQRVRLEAEERVVQEVFAAARKRLHDLPDDEYQRTVGRLAIDAARQIGGTSFRLGLPADDRDRLDIDALRNQMGEQVGGQVELAVDDEAAPIRSGVIVTSADGRRVVDDSIAGRLRRLHGELRRRVAQLLFDEKAQP
jgi:V/A-type H+-transporting ATPase subunit E